MCAVGTCGKSALLAAATLVAASCAWADGPDCMVRFSYCTATSNSSHTFNVRLREMSGASEYVQLEMKPGQIRLLQNTGGGDNQLNTVNVDSDIGQWYDVLAVIEATSVMVYRVRRGEKLSPSDDVKVFSTESTTVSVTESNRHSLRWGSGADFRVDDFVVSRLP